MGNNVALSPSAGESSCASGLLFWSLGWYIVGFISSLGDLIEWRTSVVYTSAKVTCWVPNPYSLPKPSVAFFVRIQSVLLRLQPLYILMWLLLPYKGLCVWEYIIECTCAHAHTPALVLSLLPFLTTAQSSVRPGQSQLRPLRRPLFPCPGSEAHQSMLI